jgi:hypothetical protein
MYKVDIETKQISRLSPKQFSELGLKERFDIQEWIDKSPEILGEDLLIISKELILPSDIRLDLLAIDRKGRLVIIELKRDDSGKFVEWQAIKYASYCSNFQQDEILEYFAKYLESDENDARQQIEDFIEVELENMNQEQRIILVAKEFHSDVASAVLWLRDFEIDIKCIRLQPYIDTDDNLFITPTIIIPLPEAKDYIEKKEIKRREERQTVSHRSTFSLEKGNFDIPTLEKMLQETLARPSNLTPRLACFMDILLTEDRTFGREEIKTRLFGKGIGSDVNHAGRYLSNISQFLTKNSNPHLRQIISFTSGEAGGEMKDNYHLRADYRDVVRKLLGEYHQHSPEATAL